MANRTVLALAVCSLLTPWVYRFETWSVDPSMR